ncbi:hypothetical protein EYF80_001945 [Liparis tanakae]|uniref:Uncharacterized protein n=1 Tax=Liparis tanakae TaxID=230148 RepID=A0A4Z2JD90_9TELE|nr:hypothetical protein EYF80_001945 [Liparis tanakae]
MSSLSNTRREKREERREKTEERREKREERRQKREERRDAYELRTHKGTPAGQPFIAQPTQALSSWVAAERSHHLSEGHRVHMEPRPLAALQTFLTASPLSV